MERIRILEAGLAVLAGVTVMTAIEEDTKRPALIAKGQNLQLLAACSMHPDLSELRQILSGQRTAQIGFLDASAIAVTDDQTLQQEALLTGANVPGKLGVGIGRTNTPGVRVARAATLSVISSDPDKKFQPWEIPPKEYKEDSRILEEISEVVFCPKLAVTDLIKSIIDQVDILFNPHLPRVTFSEINTSR